MTSPGLQRNSKPFTSRFGRGMPRSGPRITSLWRQMKSQSSSMLAGGYAPTLWGDQNPVNPQNHHPINPPSLDAKSPILHSSFSRPSEVLRVKMLALTQTSKLSLGVASLQASCVVPPVAFYQKKGKTWRDTPMPRRSAGGEQILLPRW